MRPSPRQVPKTASTGIRTSTRPKRSRTHPSPPPHRRCLATTPASLRTTSRRNSSNKWRTSNTCSSSSSSSKASAGNTRCHHNRECHTSNNHPDRWVAAGKTIKGWERRRRHARRDWKFRSRYPNSCFANTIKKRAPLVVLRELLAGSVGGGRRLQSFITSSNPVFTAFGGRGPPSDSWTRPARQRKPCYCFFPSSDDDVRLFGQPGKKGRKRGFAEGGGSLLEGGNSDRNRTGLTGACVCLCLRGPTGAPAAVAKQGWFVGHHTCRTSICFHPF